MKDVVGRRVVAYVLILGMAPTVAMAYIDPGNGAYIVQVLFTLAGAALFYLRHPIRSIKAIWTLFSNRNEAAAPRTDNTVVDDAGVSEVALGSVEVVQERV